MDILTILKSILPFYKQNFKSVKINALDIEVTYSDGEVLKFTKEPLAELLKSYGITVCD